MKKELIKYKNIDDAFTATIKPPVIDNYNKLIQELKFYKIGPKECFDIIYKTKFQYNNRYFWTMTRIATYIKKRWDELKVAADNNGMESYKGGFPQFKLYSNKVFTDKKIMKLINEGKVFSKKIDICRNIVNSTSYQRDFKSFYPKAKFDFRKEVQNLQKLVSEKKHRSKFIKKKWKFNFANDPDFKYEDYILKIVWYTFTQKQIDILANS